MTKRFEWPATVDRQDGGRRILMVEVRAAENARRAELNVTAMKKATEMGYSNVVPFLTEDVVSV